MRNNRLLKAAKLQGEKANAYAIKRADAEANHELSSIQYLATNPDYEMPAEEAESNLLTQEIERELFRSYDRGVCCFSRSFSSPLLWSHYGDQHRGICIGYGLQRNPKPTIHKVSYVSSRAILTSKLFDAFVSSEPNACIEVDHDVLLRKARGWRYEREWRVLGFRGVQPSPLLLKEVTFGLRCLQSVKHAVIQALIDRDKPVAFLEIYELPHRYDLKRRRVDSDELAGWLPRTAESGEELFGEASDQPDPPQAASK